MGVKMQKGICWLACLPWLSSRAPEIEMRFQVCEFLDCAIDDWAITIIVFIQESEGEKVVGLLVVFCVSHDGLLGHADYVAGWDVASVGEVEVF